MDGKELTPEQIDGLVKAHEDQIAKLQASKGVIGTVFVPETNPDGSAVTGEFSPDARAAMEKRNYFKGVVAGIERERQRIAATNTVLLGDTRISEKAACDKVDAVLCELSTMYSKII